MNTQRIVVLGLALVAACGAAFVVRGMMGGGTPQTAAAPAPQIAMSEVMVASEALQPGMALAAGKVRWEKWPKKSVDQSFVTRDAVTTIDDAVKDTVVRTPILAGQPITTNAIIHGTASGFMAATLTPGMRAVSIAISTEGGAGGFVLPNDRVDLILTQKSEDRPVRVRARTVLTAVRVLAVDQTPKQEKDQQAILGKTATLELTPAQAELVARAQGMGTLSLALRPVGEQSADAANSAVAANTSRAVRAPVDPLGDNFGAAGAPADANAAKSGINVVRYGVVSSAAMANNPAGRGNQRGNERDTQREPQ